MTARRRLCRSKWVFSSSVKSNFNEIICAYEDVNLQESTTQRTTTRLVRRPILSVTLTRQVMNIFTSGRVLHERCYEFYRDAQLHSRTRIRVILHSPAFKTNFEIAADFNGKIMTFPARIARYLITAITLRYAVSCVYV